MKQHHNYHVLARVQNLYEDCLFPFNHFRLLLTSDKNIMLSLQRRFRLLRSDQNVLTT